MASVLGMAAAAAQAQEPFPGKPIHIIVPFTAGSATDIVARVLAERLSPVFGQPVIVENHPGAGGTIGITQVAKAAPDGTTLGVVSTGHVVNDTLYTNLQYDTLGDFAGVAPLASLPSVLIVPPDLGVHRVADLVALAKRSPGALNYATAGIGSASHINTEKFCLAAGIKVLHIPLKGTPEILNETMGARVQMAWVPLVSSIGPIKNGKVVALAVSTPARSPTLPDVPTIAEAGYPDAEFNFWVGMLAPAKTPREIVNRLNAEIAKALRLPEVQSRIANLGAEPMFMTAEQFDAFLAQEHETLGKVMRSAGVPSH
ncbi:MAG: Bug family tripartite tricarboxylate transporter substrate binding protein [Usitatibacter sp.]